MNCTTTITADEFKTIHNAMWEMGQAIAKLEGVVHPDVMTQLLKAHSDIRGGLKAAYEQDQKSFDQKYDHYQDVADQLGLKESSWSIYEVENLSDRHPFAGADRIVYRDHWGKHPVSSSVHGSTWAALFVAANSCIRDSGDKHHRFIEQFVADKEDPRTLILTTGS